MRHDVRSGGTAGATGVGPASTREPVAARDAGADAGIAAIAGPAIPVGFAVARVRAAALALAAGSLVATADAHAQTGAATPAEGPGKVVVAGVVPDEATRQAILGRARAVYGERVVDQLGVGRGVAPPEWGRHVEQLITADLKRVSRGQLKVDGNVVELSGEIPSEADGHDLVGRMSASLNPTYTVRNGLRVAVNEQRILDAALAQRIVEFEPGNAVLTPVGLRTLDELLPVLGRFRGRHFEVIGHTDAQGAPSQNQVLSAERAATVKRYLAAKGIARDSIVTSGAGADRPIADNATVEGRARNRRIEFRVAP